MQNPVMMIDLVKLAKYLLKYLWLMIICAMIGFGFMYYNVAYNQKDMYQASGTMFVQNGNPNLSNYQYIGSSDLNTSVQLLDTYMVVVKSNRVMDVVAQNLAASYPGITPDMIRGSISMGSVSQTSIWQVKCVSADPVMAADICNAVLDVAPAEIVRVVGAGSATVVDFATVPLYPVGRGALKKGMLGGLAGAAAAAALLVLLFLLNRKVRDTKELESCYTPPVLASITRTKKEEQKPADYLLNEKSPMEKLQNYAKLRMNLLYTLVNKENNVVIVASAVSGEGKSTISANLAVSLALSGKRVLLMDADLRRGCQREIFDYDAGLVGLSDTLLGNYSWQECVLDTKWENLQLMPAGQLPPNPAELLSSKLMKKILQQMSESYDLVLIDVPPVNIVSDPLVLSSEVAGCLFVTRQHYSDHRDIRKALIAAEMTNMNVLGFVFYGERIPEVKYYSRKYYSKYDYRSAYAQNKPQGATEDQNV